VPVLCRQVDAVTGHGELFSHWAAISRGGGMNSWRIAVWRGGTLMAGLSHQRNVGARRIASGLAGVDRREGSSVEYGRPQDEPRRKKP